MLDLGIDLNVWPWVWLGIAVTPGMAQWHANGHVGTSGDRVFVFDGQGGVQSTVIAPGFADMVDLTMDVDNRLVLLVQRDQKRIVRFDPWTLTVVGTLFEGPPLDIGFNPAYLTDVLKVVDTETIKFEFSASSKPGLIRSGGDFLYVLMPVDLGEARAGADSVEFSVRRNR